MKAKKVLTQKVFFNKRTGQASLVLQKKKLLKFYDKIPKEIVIEIKKVRW